jgi:acylphosphatase
MRTVQIDVHGAVQGVGFRNHTRRAAVENDVVGWVKNNDNGTVSMVLKGDEEDVNRVIQAVRDGPALSTVEDTAITELDSDDSYESFTIRR